MNHIRNEMGSIFKWAFESYSHIKYILYRNLHGEHQRFLTGQRFTAGIIHEIILSIIDFLIPGFSLDKLYFIPQYFEKLEA